MPKRREPKATASVSQIQPSAEQIEAFAAAADDRKQGAEKEQQPADKNLDPNAKRDYKSIRVPFNQYEYEKLVEGSSASSRTKLNFIRYAILKMTEENENSGT